MQTFHHIASVREAVRELRKGGKTIGFVPTMGNLHDGHLALVQQAQEHADWVIVSIFVNRLQFGLNEDWDRYPRTAEADTAKLKAIGCDCLFYPEEAEVYPNGIDAQTRVVVPSMTDVLCGASRPKHFEGVTTVVSKLFNMVQPDLAVFGKKDFQQLAIIRRMVEDLCMPVQILEGDIVRESDGLAMSSRNAYIKEDERPKANQLNKSLNWIKTQIEQGDVDFASLEAAARNQLENAGFRPDYVKICNAATLEPAANDDRRIAILGAMYTQAARLIDNVTLERD
jgi:pantoate--beta-alanine ligase